MNEALADIKQGSFIIVVESEIQRDQFKGLSEDSIYTYAEIACGGCPRMSSCVYVPPPRDPSSIIMACS